MHFVDTLNELELPMGAGTTYPEHVKLVVPRTTLLLVVRHGRVAVSVACKTRFPTIGSISVCRPGTNCEDLHSTNSSVSLPNKQHFPKSVAHLPNRRCALCVSADAHATELTCLLNLVILCIDNWLYYLHSS